MVIRLAREAGSEATWELFFKGTGGGGAFFVVEGAFKKGKLECSTAMGVVAFFVFEGAWAAGVLECLIVDCFCFCLLFEGDAAS